MKFPPARSVFAQTNNLGRNPHRTTAIWLFVTKTIIMGSAESKATARS